MLTKKCIYVYIIHTIGQLNMFLTRNYFKVPLSTYLETVIIISRFIYYSSANLIFQCFHISLLTFLERGRSTAIKHVEKHCIIFFLPPSEYNYSRINICRKLIITAVILHNMNFGLLKA